MKRAIARLLRWDCTMKDWYLDDCRYWVKTYDLTPCRHCSWRFGL